MKEELRLYYCRGLRHVYIMWARSPDEAVKLILKEGSREWESPFYVREIDLDNREPGRAKMIDHGDVGPNPYLPSPEEIDEM